MHVKYIYHNILKSKIKTLNLLDLNNLLKIAHYLLNKIIIFKEEDKRSLYNNKIIS